MVVGSCGRAARWRFRAKWVPVRVKKTRRNKNLEPPLRYNRSGKGSGRASGFGRPVRFASQHRSDGVEPHLGHFALRDVAICAGSKGAPDVL